MSAAIMLKAQTTHRMSCRAPKQCHACKRRTDNKKQGTTNNIEKDERKISRVSAMIFIYKNTLGESNLKDATQKGLMEVPQPEHHACAFFILFFSRDFSSSRRMGLPSRRAC